MGNFLGKTISNLIGIGLSGRFGAKGFAFNFGCHRKEEKLDGDWG